MVFVDSNVFIAIWDKDNAFHDRAVAKSKQLEKTGESIVISNIIIYEVATVLAMRVAKSKSREFLSSIEHNPMQTIFVDGRIDSEAKEIFQKITDKDVSFFDCTSFAIIEQFGFKKVFSFDKDFLKYGQRRGWEFV